MTVSEVRRC